MYKNELEIDVLRCLRAVAKRWKLIIVVSMLSLIVGLGLTLDVGEDKYTSVATVYAAAGNSYSDAANAVTAMNAYLDVATSYKVSQRAALIMGRNDIDAADVQNAISVNSSQKQTGSGSNISNFMASYATIISFYATTTDPKLSEEIADAAAESYAIEMGNILNTDVVKKLDSATEAELTFNAQIEALKDRIKFMVAGFAFACLVIVLCEIFDNRVRTIRDATIMSELPVIGMIPDYKE